jgi:hypothetical protein
MRSIKGEEMISLFSVFVLFLYFFLPQLSFAAGQEGNGGDVIVCRDIHNQNKVTSIALLDFYESQILRNIVPDLDPNVSVESNFDVLLSRLERRDPVFKNRVLSLYSKFFHETKFTNETLEDIPDSEHLSFPVSCHVEQIAIQGELAKKSHGSYYLINKQLYDLLTNDHKAGLILHEILYRIYIEYTNTANSIVPRYLNSLIASDRINQLSLDDYVKLISEKFKFASFGLGNWVLPVGGKHFYDENSKLIGFDITTKILGSNFNYIVQPQTVYLDKDNYVLFSGENGRVKFSDSSLQTIVELSGTLVPGKDFIQLGKINLSPIPVLEPPDDYEWPITYWGETPSPGNDKSTWRYRSRETSFALFRSSDGWVADGPLQIAIRRNILQDCNKTILNNLDAKLKCNVDYTNKNPHSHYLVDISDRDQTEQEFALNDLPFYSSSSIFGNNTFDNLHYNSGLYFQSTKNFYERVDLRVPRLRNFDRKFQSEITFDLNGQFIEAEGKTTSTGSDEESQIIKITEVHPGGIPKAIFCTKGDIDNLCHINVRTKIKQTLPVFFKIGDKIEFTADGYFFPQSGTEIEYNMINRVDYGFNDQFLFIDKSKLTETQILIPATDLADGGKVYFSCNGIGIANGTYMAGKASEFFSFYPNGNIKRFVAGRDKTHPNKFDGKVLPPLMIVELTTDGALKSMSNALRIQCVQ